MLEKGYQSIKAYAISKLALIMNTYTLSRKLEGSGVTVNAAHPGEVRTQFGKEGASKFFKFIYKIQDKFKLTPEQGAETIVYLATSNEVEGVSGKYFAKCKEKKSAKKSYDTELQEQVWNECLSLTEKSK